MKNKVVLITGGGTGIGEAIAIAFCKNGYDVYIIFWTIFTCYWANIDYITFGIIIFPFINHL